MTPAFALAHALALAAGVPFPSGPGWAGRAIGKADTHRRDGRRHTCGRRASNALKPVWRVIFTTPRRPIVSRRTGKRPPLPSPLVTVLSQVPTARKTDRRDSSSRECGRDMAIPISLPSEYSWPTEGKGRKPT